jgi:tetratricopeptide (TPR) repeat protein
MAARKHDNANNVVLAREYYNKVNRIQPENKDNTLYYGRFLIAQNDLVAAKSVLAEALSYNHSQPICLLQGDVHYGLAQYDSAAYYYHLALGERADTATFNRVLDSYGLAGNSDSLISLGQSAVLTFPENKDYLLITARTLDRRFRYDDALPYYLTLYQLDTLDTLVKEELSYLQRKIAYLQRKRQEQRILADSLSKTLLEEL